MNILQNVMSLIGALTETIIDFVFSIFGVFFIFFDALDYVMAFAVSLVPAFEIAFSLVPRPIIMVFALTITGSFIFKLVRSVLQ